MIRAALLSIAVALVVAPASAPAASAKCQNLPAPASLRAKLERVHYALGGADTGHLARGSLFYGRCGGTRYAIGTWTKAPADPTEVFRRLPGRGWKDRGDGYEGCGDRRVPRALARLWGLC